MVVPLEVFGARLGSAENAGDSGLHVVEGDEEGMLDLAQWVTDDNLGPCKPAQARSQSGASRRTCHLQPASLAHIGSKVHSHASVSESIVCAALFNSSADNWLRWAGSDGQGNGQQPVLQDGKSTHWQQR